MYILEENLKKINGADVTVDIAHKLYGNQKIRCNLDCIFDEKRIGFRVKSGQDIFIYRESLVDYGIKDGIYFADDVMKINIKFNNAG